MPEHFTVIKANDGKGRYVLSNEKYLIDNNIRNEGLIEVFDTSIEGAVAKINYTNHVKEKIKNLPTLVGSDAQIEFGGKRRKSILSSFIDYLYEYVYTARTKETSQIQGSELMDKEFIKTTDFILGIRSSKFWIELNLWQESLLHTISAIQLFFNIEGDNIVPKGVKLGELTGSEKQVRWAEGIRASFIIQALSKLSKFNRFAPNAEKRAEVIINANKKLFGTSEAKFWIDNRDESYEKLFTKIVENGN